MGANSFQFLITLCALILTSGFTTFFLAALLPSATFQSIKRCQRSPCSHPGLRCPTLPYCSSLGSPMPRFLHREELPAGAQRCFAMLLLLSWCLAFAVILCRLSRQPHVKILLYSSHLLLRSDQFCGSLRCQELWDAAWWGFVSVHRVD